MTLRVTPAEIVAAAEAAGSPGLLAVAPGWSRVRLGDVARVVNGAPFSSHHFNIDGIGMPLVRIRDVKTSTVSTWYNGPWETTHLVEPGALLVGMDGDFNAAIWHGPTGVLNQRVCRIDVDSKRYDRRFLEYVLPGYLDAIWKATSSTTVKHLSSRSIADIPLPNPPWDEQRQIVAILEDHLSRLDATKHYLDAAAGRLRMLERSALDEIVWASGSPTVPLASVLREPMRNGFSARASATGSVRILTLTAVTRRAFTDEYTKLTDAPTDRVRNLWLEPGDIFVQRANTAELVGSAALYTGPRDWAVFPDLLIRLRVDLARATPEYLALVLRTERCHRELRSRAKGLAGSMPKIDQAAIGELRVPCPSAEAQAHAVREAEARGSAIEAVSRATQKALLRTASLRRTLLVAALSGALTGRSSDLEIAEELVFA